MPYLSAPLKPEKADKAMERQPEPMPEVLVARKGMTLSHDIDDYPGGIVIPIDTPYRWTSADVIRKVKWMAIKHFGKKNLKVGHAGTLDPLATGVLLVCIGKATKSADAFQAHPKQYLAGVSFGAVTASYDLEKEIDQLLPTDGVRRDTLEAVLQRFVGEQDQVAPLFSAKSVDGSRVYETARRLYNQARREGRPFDPEAADSLIHASRITLYDLRLLSFRQSGSRPEETNAEELPHGREPRIHVADISGYRLPQADILVDCSKGTYIRALARDLGEALGSGAFLHALRRTKTGPFHVEEALSMDDLAGLFA